MHTFKPPCLGLRERCNRLIRENMEPHFTVLSSIVTTWIDERFVRQTSAISATEWDSMKRYLVAYMQAIHQLGMIKKVLNIDIFKSLSYVAGR